MTQGWRDVVTWGLAMVYGFVGTLGALRYSQTEAVSASPPTEVSALPPEEFAGGAQVTVRFVQPYMIVDECGLTYLHVFPFSPRPGTPAARMPQLEKSVIKERAARLRAKGEARLDAFLASQVGSTRQVLIETEAMGRTEHFAQVKFASRMTPGAIVSARVTGRGPSHLEARLAA